MFKTLLHIAYRNAFLRRSRAILLVLMIGLSMGIMVGLEGLYDGMSQHMIDKTMRSDSGNISLYAQKYRLEDDIRYHISEAAEKVKKISALPGVESALWRIQANGLAQTARKSKSARLIGIDIEAEEKFGKISDFLEKGTLDFGKNSVFVGSELAKKLNLHLGSKVIFTTQDSHHEIQSVAFHVKAILHTTNVNLDERALFMSRKKMTELLALKAGTATQIAVMAGDTDIQMLQKTLKGLYPKLDVKTFVSLYPQLKQMQSLMNVFNEITFFIVMIVVFIGIMGVMYVSILDRIREFGILLSIGYAYRYIRWQILVEALFLGLAGYLLGVIVGLAFLAYLKYHGLDLSIFAAGMSMFGLDSIVYATIKVHYFVSTLLAIVAASVFSVVLPLRKIKKLNPIEVIRNEG